MSTPIIPTCKTCRFWLSGAELGNCTKPIQDGAIVEIATQSSRSAISVIESEVNAYIEDLDIDDEIDVESLAEAIAENLEDYSTPVGIRTRYDFLCNQHPDFARLAPREPIKFKIRREDVQVGDLFIDSDGTTDKVIEIENETISWTDEDGFIYHREIDYWLNERNTYNAKRYTPAP